MDPNQSLRDQLLKSLALFMRNAMHSTFMHARSTGLSMPQLNTLMQLSKKDGAAISEIADEMGVSNAAASQMIDRMVHEGLILRTEDPNDRRVKQISLTDKGRQLVQEHFNARRKWHQQILDLLTDEEIEQIYQAFEILSSKITLLDNHSNSECGEHP